MSEHSSTIRPAFVQAFGEENAAAIEAAAEGHKNGLHDNPGSDSFKWALCICIGYECMSAYAEGHGITAPWDSLKHWIINHADLGSHDGDVDFLSAFCGAYAEYMPAVQS